MLAPESFIDAYIECALWSESAYIDGENDDRSFSDHNYDRDDLSPDALKKITEDCNDFYKNNIEMIYNATDNYDYDDSQAGHDFWLSRNGHGTGAWDRGLGSIGDKLHAAMKTYGECHLYLNGDQIELN